MNNNIGVKGILEQWGAATVTMSSIRPGDHPTIEDSTHEIEDPESKSPY